MRNVIGIDLGGTNVRAGLVSDSGLLKIAEFPLGEKKEKEEVLNSINNLIDKIADIETAAIGVGVPSVVDTKKGIVYDVINIPSWKKVPLKDILEKKYSLPVKINNDANCFVMAEKHFGKGKGFKDIIGLIIGTGLGAGIIINDKLYEGLNCGAGEFGMIPFKDHVVETYCSGQFFQKFHNISGADLLKNKDSKRTKKIFSEFGDNLAEGVKIILYSYDPQLIVLGGSVSESYPLFKDSMIQGMQDFAYGQTLKNIKIKISSLKYPGVLGAAGLVL